MPNVFQPTFPPLSSQCSISVKLWCQFSVPWSHTQYGLNSQPIASGVMTFWKARMGLKVPQNRLSAFQQHVCFGHIAQRGEGGWLLSFPWRDIMGINLWIFCVALSSKYRKPNRMACVWKGDAWFLGALCRNDVFSMPIYFPIPSSPFSLLPAQHLQAWQQRAPLLSQCLKKGSLFKQCLELGT